MPTSRDREREGGIELRIAKAHIRGGLRGVPASEVLASIGSCRRHLAAKRGMTPVQLSSGAREIRENVVRMDPDLPPPPRDCFAHGLLAYGFGPERRSMTPAHQLELVDRYPGLYRLARAAPGPMCEPFSREGFACGDGWFGIIARLSARLASDPSLVVAQLKEKIGGLRIYFCGVAPELAPEIVGVVSRAIRTSRRTCEICGEPGTLDARLRGWYSVRCAPSSWLDEMMESCHRLADIKRQGANLAIFRKRPKLQDAARRHLQHLGEAARHQSAKRRRSLPGVDWERLDGMGAIFATESWTAVELWRFIRKDAPTIAMVLR